MSDPVTPVENYWYHTYRKIQCFTHFGTRQKRTRFVAVEELTTQLHKMQKNFKKGKKK